MAQGNTDTGFGSDYYNTQIEPGYQRWLGKQGIAGRGGPYQNYMNDLLYRLYAQYVMGQTKQWGGTDQYPDWGNWLDTMKGSLWNASQNPLQTLQGLNAQGNRSPAMVQLYDPDTGDAQANQWALAGMANRNVAQPLQNYMSNQGFSRLKDIYNQKGLAGNQSWIDWLVSQGYK